MLKIENLSIFIKSEEADFTVLDNLSYSVEESQIAAVVGESGSGKTMHALSLMQLLPSQAYAQGSVKFKNTDILKLKGEALREVRGGQIGIVFQDPMSSLNPVFSVGTQITETLLAHQKLTKKQAQQKAIKLLKKVGLSADVLKKYPHQLSGGMSQRVMIAIALCCGPKIFIADEPTTALDVVVQAQILALIKDLQKQQKLTVIFITHNLAIVDDLADKVIVLYAGQKVEEASKDSLFKNTLHPYTKGLLGSVVSLSDDKKELSAIQGNPPLPGQVFEGCKFEPRCSLKIKKCACAKPPLFEPEPGHFVRCWLYGDKAVAK